MQHFLTRRILQSLLVLAGAWTASFILLQAMPGDAALIKMLTSDNSFTLDELENLRRLYGSDAPVWQRFLYSTGRFLSGDLGISVQHDVPVRTLLAANLPHTLKLAALGLGAASLLAVLIAFLATAPGMRWLRAAMLAMPPLLAAVPTFWLAVMLIQLFSFRLGWVPIVNPGPLQSLLLPVLTIGLSISAPIAQVLLRSIDEVEALGFVAVARAKGLGRTRVLAAHTARNALLPALTMAGLMFGEVLGGAVVTETIFGLNGIGRLVQGAVSTQDLAVLQALVVLASAAFVLINLGIDLIYPWLDPRLRSEGARGLGSRI